MFRSRCEQIWGSPFAVHGSPFVLVLIVVLVLDWSYEGVTSVGQIGSRADVPRMGPIGLIGLIGPERQTPKDKR